MAPLEMPTGRPSSAERRCTMRIASPSSTAITESSSPSRQIAGMNLSEIPWMGCRPTLQPVDRVGELAGSSGCMRMEGQCSRRKAPEPMMMSSVPTTATKACGTRPMAASWARISGPVLARCAAILLSLSNWRGRKAPGCRCANCSASAMLPRKPLHRG